MKPKIEVLNEKKIVGIRCAMSLSDNKTEKLWKDFMPRRKEICADPASDLISVSVYEPAYFTDFNPMNEFEKWAAIEVRNFDNVPDGMETFVLKSGLYAVFDYKGSSTDNSIFRYIFEVWLPGSGYVLDDRPHFEVLGEKYKNNDPGSEETIWIPIKEK